MAGNPTADYDAATATTPFPDSEVSLTPSVVPGFFNSSAQANQMQQGLAKNIGIMAPFALDDYAQFVYRGWGKHMNFALEILDFSPSHGVIQPGGIVTFNIEPGFDLLGPCELIIDLEIKQSDALHWFQSAGLDYFMNLRTGLIGGAPYKIVESVRVRQGANEIASLKMETVPIVFDLNRLDAEQRDLLDERTNINSGLLGYPDIVYNLVSGVAGIPGLYAGQGTVAVMGGALLVGAQPGNTHTGTVVDFDYVIDSGADDKLLGGAPLANVESALYGYARGNSAYVTPASGRITQIRHYVVDLPFPWTRRPDLWIAYKELGTKLSFEVKLGNVRDFIVTDKLSSTTVTVNSMKLRANVAHVPQALSDALGLVINQGEGNVYKTWDIQEAERFLAKTGEKQATVPLTAVNGAAIAAYFVIRKVSDVEGGFTKDLAAPAADITTSHVTQPFLFQRLETYEMTSSSGRLFGPMDHDYAINFYKPRFHTGKNALNIYPIIFATNCEERYDNTGYYEMANRANVKLIVNFPAALTEDHYIDFYALTHQIHTHSVGEYRRMFS